MLRIRPLAPALILIALALLLLAIPYEAAERSVPSNQQFTGFLINPWDGFSYLAKMRQGADGAWLFQLPYTPQPGQPAFLFGYYLFLGHLSRWIGQSLLAVFHGARLLNAALMYALIYVGYRRWLPSPRAAQAGLLLTILSGGLGWVGVPFGLVASDLNIPESIPFLSAYTNAHFPLAVALLISGHLLVSEVPFGRIPRLLLATACGALQAIVLPFTILAQGAVLVIWLLWEQRWSNRFPDAGRPILRKKLEVAIALGIGAGPWLAYDLWLTIGHPVLSIWSRQNQTPSPALWSYLLGFGVVLLLAILAAMRAGVHRLPSGRLLLVWAAATFLLLYAPIGLQRRFSIGIYIPLVALAVWYLEARFRSNRPWRWSLILTTLLSVPSLVFVVLAGIAGVARGEPLLILTQAEIRAYHWLRDHAPAGALVLAAPLSGNRLPAFADVRVIYGHPFETPNAGEAREAIEALYEAGVGLEPLAGQAEGMTPVYAIFGPQEKELGAPSWLEGFEPVVRMGDVQIFQLPNP